MMNEDPGKVDFSDIGGLGDQLRILRETIELPITNPELFKRVGIKPPKGIFTFINQVASCTALQVLEKPLSQEPSHAISKPNSWKSLLQPSSINTSDNQPESSEKCSAMPKKTNHASFSWMKLMPLVEEGSVKVAQPTEKYKELWWNFSTSWTVLMILEESRLSWLQTDLIFWIRLFSGQEDLTGR